MEERPGRSSNLSALAVRGTFAAALLALAAAAVAVPYQRSGAPILLAAAVVLAAALALPSATVVVAAGAVALLPVLGNLLAGPWVAPAELLLLLLAAAALARPAAAPPAPLGSALAVSTVAVAASAAAATFAALAPGELPGALRALAVSFFSPGADHAASPVRAALVHAAGLLGYLLFRRAAREGGARTPLLAVVCGLSLVGAYSILEASTGLKLWGPSHYEAHSLGLRVPSTLPDYNATGAAMALGLFPALVLVREARGGRRLAAAGMAGLLLAGLLLSGSRGAWLAAGVAATAAVAGALRSRSGRNERRRLAVAAALAFGAALAAIALWPGDVGQLLRRRAATLVDPGASLQAVHAGRVGFWKAGARMVAEHPLAGVGPGRVPARFAEFRDPSFPVEAENLHAYYLQAAAENGLPGGLLVLWPFVPLALAARRLLASGDALASPHGALAPGLLAFALTGLSSHPWLLPEMQFLFWGVAALLPAKEPSPPAPARARRLLPWALLAVWGAARLLAAPGTERGRFGYAEWGARGGPDRYFWTGPHALVPVDVPPGGAVRVRVRGMLPDVEARSVVVSLRLDGGPARSITLADASWQDVVMVRGPYRPGDGTPDAVRRGLLRVESSRGFCPAREGGADRRLLSVQLARPPVAPARAAVP